MDLREAIEEARQRVTDPPPNESTTCDWIILPLLRAAGYAVREIVSRDADAQRGFPDYTVLPKDGPHTFYVEAKAWNVNLEDGHAAQTINYANSNGKRWAVLTNGRQWRLYDNDIRGLPAEKLVAQAGLEEADQTRMLAFLTAIGKDSVCSGRLAPYAEQEVKRRADEERTRKDKEDDARRRERLAGIIEKEIVEAGSPLVGVLLAHLRTREGLADLTADDLSRFFQGIEGGTSEPAETSPNWAARVPTGESDEVLVIPAREAWGFYLAVSAYQCQHDRTFRETTRLAFYHDGAIERSVPRILDSVLVPKWDEESVRKEPGFSTEMRTRLLDLIRLIKEKGLTPWLNGEPVQITFLSSLDSPQTITLPRRVLNDKTTKDGKPWGFVIAQRYVSLAELLKGPSKTSELED
ncbi:MAG: hypothetical protein ACE15C_06895 [Phycisphaerae bacterium]